MAIKHDRKIAVHPGEVLGELLSEMSISQSALARHIGVTQAYISDIVNGRRNLSAPMAWKLSASIGLAAEAWMNLQKNWELSQVDPKIVKGIKKMAA